MLYVRLLASCASGGWVRRRACTHSPVNRTGPQNNQHASALRTRARSPPRPQVGTLCDYLGEVVVAPHSHHLPS